ncbi:hypothetical protein A6D6_01040 [Alcanivorax xiamenensis]|uniref:Cobalt/nickel transport protein n=1 Tax=Alcanivorax xiamenensis TaxID=1177156 RepID=A0ABQ6YAT7_9GAMM|nr:DUF4198 domain-containing protein [Alcanivorax xiamenensis]KAF0807041.1 hypothetical protein A6D6_01040 [Alcanivorax xiamenensis]
MKPVSLAAAAVSALLLLSPTAQAHKRWLLPTHSVVSEAQWISVDASVSNDIFYPDRAYPLDNLQVTGPDGKAAETDHLLEMHRRSVFDVNLAQTGSYRIALPGHFFLAFFEQDGERKRVFGENIKALLKKVPKGADKVRLVESVSRIETFASVGAPDTAALAVTGKGLELVPLTHPNDLYTGETARFRFVIDGKPAAGLEVLLLPAGTRYRDAQQDWAVTSDDNGEVAIDWPHAGRFFMEAETTDQNTSDKQAESRRLGYLGTFEVLPL